MHHRLRADATRVLVHAARARGVARFVKESVTFTDRDGGDRWLDESVPLVDLPVWRSTLEGERLVAGLTADGGCGVVLRFGALYAPGARSTDEYRRLVRLHLSPVIGPRDAYVSSTHAHDAATAIHAALAAPPGVYNVVDDEPLTRRDYAAAVGRAFGAGRLWPMPTAPMRLLAGDAVRQMAASQRVGNRAFVAATGWRPRWGDARRGWAAIAAPGGPDVAVASR